MNKYDIIRLEEGFGTINDDYFRYKDTEFKEAYAFITSEEFLRDFYCPYCEVNLTIVEIDADNYSSSDPTFDSTELSSNIYICWNCMYWKFFYQMWPGPGANFCTHASISKVQEFEKELPSGCLSELAQFLRRNPTYWNKLKSKRLEEIVADIFKANYQNCDVFHVGKPNDGGIDVVFVQNESKKWLIQVKGHENTEKGEGVGTIRDLMGAMLLKDNDFGIVVSTHGHFTKPALKAIKTAKLRGMRIDHIDRGKLDLMLNPILPSETLISLLREEYFDIYEQLPTQIMMKLEMLKTNQHQLPLF